MRSWDKYCEDTEKVSKHSSVGIKEGDNNGHYSGNQEAPRENQRKH
jgi:hypothetical protein